MLGRYRIVRGKRAPDDPLPDGVRQDTRKHTRHVLRPDTDAVKAFLDNPSDAAWKAFARDYEALLERRRTETPEAFDELAARATDEDVWIGCNCPTAKNPDVRRCHTYLALRYMAKHYPELDITWPDGTAP